MTKRHKDAPLEPGRLFISFDPGETSGLAVCRYVEDTSFDLLRVEQFTWEQRFQVIEEVVALDVTTIIYERFLLYPSKANEMVYNEFHSSQVIGSISYVAWKMGKLELMVGQMAADRLYAKVHDVHKNKVANVSDHAYDAYLHAALYVNIHSNRIRVQTQRRRSSYGR